MIRDLIIGWRERLTHVEMGVERMLRAESGAQSPVDQIKKRR